MLENGNPRKRAIVPTSDPTGTSRSCSGPRSWRFAGLASDSFSRPAVAPARARLAPQLDDRLCPTGQQANVWALRFWCLQASACGLAPGAPATLIPADPPPASGALSA